MAEQPFNGDMKQRLRDLEQENRDILKAYRELQEAEELYRVTLENIADTIVITDDRGEFVYVCLNTTNIFGLSREEVYERSSIRELLGGSPCEHAELRERGEINNIEWSITDRRGQNHHLLIHAKSVNIGGGTSLYVMRDITERKRLVDATGRMARVGGWELDADTLAVSWTEETCRIHEVSLDHNPQLQEAINYFHPGERQRLSTAIRRALDHGEPYDMELRLITAKGKQLWTRTICEPEVVNGKTVRLLGTFQDITSRREAEQALQQSERNFRELFNSISDLIYTQDLEGRFLSVNPSMCERFGYEEAEFIGRKASEFMAPKVRDLFESEYVEGIKEKGYYEGTASYYRKDGEKVFVEYRSKLIEPEDGNAHISGIGRDVTHRVTARKEKRRLEDQLLQARKMETIATLTGGIAHDYNNLLSIIMGNLSLALEETEPGSQLADFLREVEKASEKVRDLTHELMTLSRGSAPAKEVMSITPLLRSVGSAVAAKKSISLEEILPHDLWPIPHDPHKLGSVFRNVVTNAVEAMPDGGELTIKARNLQVDDGDTLAGLSLKPGDYVQVTISDQGVGIPEDHLNKLFDPYFSTKPMGVQKGMGLGLATAYANVKKHGGNMAVESSPGEGTAVHIYLPAESVTKSVQNQSSSRVGEASVKKRILLMEDEKMLSNLARHMLSRLGYEPVTVADGAEAIEMYRSVLGSDTPFDAVILDLTIKGGMGGEETMRELLRMDPDVKAIVCSGYDDDPLISDFKAHGFKGAMAKPYDMKHLKEVLEEVIS